MGLRINTNVASLTAQKNLATVSMRLQGNYSRLSSGLRIASAADDAAGLAISERMRSQIRSLTVAGRNAQDGVSLSQTAEGALHEVSNVLVRMRELALQSTNGTVSSTDRATIDVEFQEMIAEIDRIAQQADFNGIPLLDGSSTSVTVQVGIDTGETITITLDDMQAAALAISNEDVTTSGTADSALAVIDTAIDSVNVVRGGLGASQNRIESALRSILATRENLSAAESRIRDVDVASETADLTRNSIMQQAAVSVLQQANVQPQIALSLLQG